MLKKLLLAIGVANLVTAIGNRKNIKYLIMATQAQFDAVMSELDSATNDIAQELIDLQNEIKGGGLNEEAESSVLTGLSSLAQRLKGLAKNTDNPVPDPEPTPDPVPTPDPTPEPEPTPDPVPEPSPEPTPDPEPAPPVEEEPQAKKHGKKH